MACPSAAMYVRERVSTMETPCVEHSCCSLGLSSVSYRICMCGPWCDVRCSSPAHLTIISVSAFSLLSWCVAYVWFSFTRYFYSSFQNQREEKVWFLTVMWHAILCTTSVLSQFLSLLWLSYVDLTKKTICCLGTEVISLVYLTLSA